MYRGVEILNLTFTSWWVFFWTTFGYWSLVLNSLILFLLKGEEPLFFVSCDELLSLEHILLFCSDLMDVRKRYFNVDSLKVLFEEISSDVIFNCLKVINILYKLYVFDKKYTFRFNFELFECMTEGVVFKMMF